MEEDGYTKRRKGNPSNPNATQGYIFLTLRRSLTPRGSEVPNPNAKSHLNKKFFYSHTGPTLVVSDIITYIFS